MVEHQQRLLEASGVTPARRVVYASSSSLYGHAATLPTREDATPRPFSPYGVTKLAAEQLCRLVRRRARQSGDVLHTGADIGRARAALGFDPAVSLEEGLRAELDWVRARVLSPEPQCFPYFLRA